MIKCIKNNIVSLFRNQKILATLLIVVQIFSVIVVLFSYGVSNHYDMKTGETEGKSLVYEIAPKKNEESGSEETYRMTRSEMDRFLDKVLPYIQNKLEYFFVMGSDEDILIMSSTGYKDGEYTISPQYKKSIGINEGEYFTYDDMNSGEKLALVDTKELLDEDGYVTVLGEKYYAKGIVAAGGSVYIPYKSMPSELEYFHVSFILSKPLFESEFNYIMDWAKVCFGEDNVKLPEFDGVANETQYRVYRDIMVVTMLLIAVCAINYCIIYRYILEKRRRTFAVTRICGCSKYKAAVIYMVELLGISLITLMIGFILYSQLVLPQAASSFEYIEYFYNAAVYTKIAALYIGILLVTYTVLVIGFVRKTPVSVIREV